MPASVTRVAANVPLDGPVSLPAAVSNAMSARRDSGLALPLATPTTSGRAVRDPSASSSRTSSAPAPDWLTITSVPAAARAGSRKWSSSAVSIGVASTPARPRTVAAAEQAAAELPMPVSTIGAPGRQAAASAASRSGRAASAVAARSIAAGWPRISPSQASGRSSIGVIRRP